MSGGCGFVGPLSGIAVGTRGGCRLRADAMPGRCPRRSAVRMRGERGGDGPMGKWVRRAFLTEVDIPLVIERRTVKSGYLLATALTAVFGGGGIALSFVFFLGLCTLVDAPPFFAAVSAAVTSLLIELLHVNTSAMMGARADLGEFVLGLITFAAVLGVLYGVDPDASLALPDSDAPPRRSDTFTTPRAARDTFLDGEQPNNRSLKGSEQDEFSEQLRRDLQQWDEKFIDKSTAPRSKDG